MAVFKCKMCGGDLEILENATVCECEYCGTKQTLPKLNDEKRVQLYDRANYFRRENEFDKAMGIYEMILSEANDDAESYWGIVLCRYGIEYVEDPRTHRRIPTVNRAQFTSIFDDEDYKKAIQYADTLQKEVYEAEATVIDKIQKGILDISNKEEPFDVFICYKETDENGQRTKDSVYAQSIYDWLVKQGYKVFFSRITLEDKLGSAYEPYIFAALNSARVMLVVGTKKEHFNAVWVKNEWSRFLSLIKAGKEKTIIPVYKDISPYDLPEEFQYLQAQDMNKIGFSQDLGRGIRKLIPISEPATVKETVVVNQSQNSNVAPLLERAFMFLEDGDWNSADEYCEKVLDLDPKNAEAYLGKLMAELQVKKQEFLKVRENPFDNNANYKKAIRFADEKLKSELAGYIEYINIRNENAKKKAEEEKKKCNELFIEYKAAVQSEKTGVAKKSEADKKITSLNIAFRNLSDLKNSWQDIEDEFFSLSERLKRIESEIASLASEKSNLGFFAGKQKKEIIERIAMLKKDQKSLMDGITSLEKKKQGYNTQSEIESNINRILQQIEEQKNIIEELSYVRSKQTIRDELRAFQLGKMMLQKFDVLQNIKKGQYIIFGAYEQDNNTSSGKEAVEWLVLEVKDGKALVISKRALDCKQYNTSYTNVTWETCTLRNWLNNEFINAAFSADEKAMIPTVTVSADKNPEYSTNPGKATQDKVFLPSITEVNKYFSSDSARQCEPTDYAVASGAYVNSDNGNCWWWLRSPGYFQNCAAYSYDGDVSERGGRVDYGNGAVRPALWIEIE